FLGGGGALGKAPQAVGRRQAGSGKTLRRRRPRCGRERFECTIDAPVSGAGFRGWCFVLHDLLRDLLPSPVIRVLIAADHPLVRDGLRALVSAQRGIEVVAETSTGAETLRRTCELVPDVVVMDVSMPDMGGIETAQSIATSCPQAKILALTMHEERGYLTRML